MNGIATQMNQRNTNKHFATSSALELHPIVYEYNISNSNLTLHHVRKNKQNKQVDDVRNKKLKVRK